MQPPDVSRGLAPLSWRLRVLLACIGTLVVALMLGSVVQFMVREWLLGCALLAGALLVEVLTMWMTRPAIARGGRR